MSIGLALQRILNSLPQDEQAQLVDDLLKQSEEGLGEAKAACNQMQQLIADLHQQIQAQDTLIGGLQERTKAIRGQAPVSHSEKVLTQAGASMSHFLASRK